MSDELPPFDPSKPSQVAGGNLPAFDPARPSQLAPTDASGAGERVYLNDAGQPFTMSGRPPPSPSDRDTTGSILPFSGNAMTSGLHLAFPEAIASPLRGMEEGGERAMGVGEAGQNPLRPLSPDTLAAVGAVSGTPLGGRDLLGATGMSSAERAAAKSARAGAVAENQARSAISRQFAKGTEGGAPTASDVIGEMNKARAQGQPLTLSDVNNTELGALSGATYRQGGAARSLIKSFMTQRQAEAGERVKGLINRNLSDQSLRDTSEKLIADRSAHAKPLWDEAARGGSVAPLERQFETAFNEAGAGEREAAQKVSQAQQAMTVAKGKQSLAGNVYTQSHATETMRTAQKQLNAAQTDLQKITQAKEAVRSRLRQAQEDRTATAPGAIWSPRLQKLLDQPEVQAGIKRGWNIERRNAVGKGEPFNSSEYAITGIDESGNPIVGKVPNMRLLMVAKEGLDAIIDSPSMKNGLTGRPTKSAVSYMNLRDGLVSELDRLNPLYKQARDQWSGETSSIKALDDGRHFMDKGRFSIEELPAHYAKLSENEQQFFVLGVADALKEKLFGTADAANKGGAIINNEATRMRLRPLFKSDEEAGVFIDSIERERQMAQTPGRIYGGSPTAGRGADDKTNEALVHAAHGVGHILHGNFLMGIASAMRVRRLFGGKPNPASNEAIALHVTDPNVQLNETGPLMSPIPVLPKPPMVSPPPPGRAAAAGYPGAVVGSQGLPQSDTDPYAAQFGAQP